MAVIRMNLLSTKIGYHTNVNIIIPTDGMDDLHAGTTVYQPGIKYQTLWLLHGGGGDSEDFISFSNIVRYADENKIAVVMPSGYNVFYKDKYYEFVTEELPLALHTLLPLSDKREDNFIGGLSVGGDCAMRACLEYPERYAAGLIMSAAGTEHHGAVGEAPLRFDVFGLAKRDMESGLVPELIFATGSGDRGFPYYIPIIDRLDEMGLPVKRHYVDGDGHSWDFWDSTVRLALNELLPIKHSIIRPE